MALVFAFPLVWADTPAAQTAQGRVIYMATNENPAVGAPHVLEEVAMADRLTNRSGPLRRAAER